MRNGLTILPGGRDEHHEELMAQVHHCLAHWVPQLEWLWGWRISAAAVPEDEHGWRTFIAIDSEQQIAQLQVKNPWRDDPSPAGMTLELVCVQALCQILFWQLREYALACPDDEYVLGIQARTINRLIQRKSWMLARTLLKEPS